MEHLTKGWVLFIIACFQKKLLIDTFRGRIKLLTQLPQLL